MAFNDGRIKMFNGWTKLSTRDNSKYLSFAKAPSFDDAVALVNEGGVVMAFSNTRRREGKNDPTVEVWVSAEVSVSAPHEGDVTMVLHPTVGAWRMFDNNSRAFVCVITGTDAWWAAAGFGASPVEALIFALIAVTDRRSRYAHVLPKRPVPR